MIFTPLFNDFTSEERFIALQNKFERFDTNRRGLDEDLFTQVIKEDFTITLQISEENKSDNYTIFSFYNDFLNPKISDLGTETIEKIKQKINNEFNYNEIERNSFLQITINDFLLINHNIIETDYLLFDIKEKLIFQTNVVLEFLKDYNFNNSNNIIDKFQSKLNRTDLLLLLHLFRENGILDHRVDSQFGHLIERNFQYFDNKTKKYKNILKANKTVNEIKNDNKSFQKSIKRLKAILQSDSFFDLNP